MLNAEQKFLTGITEARQSTTLFDFLSGQIGVTHSFDDLLRFQLVYAVSAFDKLMHDLIRIGMRDCFIGARAQTAKYKSETIALEFHGTLSEMVKDEVTASLKNLPPPLPPKQAIFEQEIQRKLSYLAFQDPEKVADGLALIWDEKHKWDKIGAVMGKPGKQVRTQLRLIVTRRNAIVHEADLDPVLASKQPINRQTVVDSTDFIEQCGTAICQLVI